MNGLIPKRASRISFRRSFAATACLLSGFLAGTHLSFPAFPVVHNPFHAETLDYSKISWIHHELAAKPLQFLAKSETENRKLDSGSQVAFVPFVLEKSSSPTLHRMKSKCGMLHRLQLAYDRLEKALKEKAESAVDSSGDAFFEFQMAAQRFQSDFKVAVTDPKILPSSPPSVPSKATPEAQSLAWLPQSAPLAMNRWHTAPRPALPTIAEKKISIEKKPEAPIAELTQVTYPKTTSAAVSAEAANQLDSQSVTIQASSAELNSTGTQLTSNEQQNLKNALLNQQLEDTRVASVQSVKTQKWVQQKARRASAANRVESTTASLISAEQDSPIESQASSQFGFTQHYSCKLLPHAFIRPDPRDEHGIDTQICPEHKTWISKGWTEKGWVKLEGSRHLPTLTYHPAANGGSTLLLDQNALALLALENGIHVAKGAGVITGRVPDGYKIEFTGRAEETQYFNLDHKKYFAILNAEPGAGVIELLSEKNQGLSATVFTPVLEDTITYLDLVAPQTTTIGIQVVKNGKANDPEVAGLTVGMSTQGGIQAITQSDGRAVLNNVNIEPGYPVFVDVSSKSVSHSEADYTYRFQLKQLNRFGDYVVTEISERTLYHWLHQVKQGLSDQSAMIVGLYNRKILDGFKKDYLTKITPIGDRFGLDPIDYTVLWNGKLSQSDPLEGDRPRFMAVQVPEGISQVQLINESNQIVNEQLIPVSPRVIHVISE